MKYMKKLYLLITLITASFSSNAQYSICTQYGNLTDCDTMSKGFFLVWWDKQANYSADAAVLLDSMTIYRDYCLNILAMQDPPNPGNGCFYNIYLHTPTDIFPNTWAMGQGTDSLGNPYLAIPIGQQNNWLGVSHETFHVFQYSATAPGFAYGGDSQWYTEASANWFAAKRNSAHDEAFLVSEILVRLPHVSLWLSFDNFPGWYPLNWQRQVHQYGLSNWLYYLTDIEGVDDSIITSGMYSTTTELPQEYFYNRIGGDTIRDYFLNWAAHMTNEFDYLTPAQNTRQILEWNTYSDPLDDNEYVETFSDTGTSGWYRPDTSLTTCAWAFNTYKITNTTPSIYTFSLRGDSTGSEGTPSYFTGTVVLQSAIGTTFHPLNMMNELEGAVTISMTPADTVAYLIIASTPETFTGVSQHFNYEINIGFTNTTDINKYEPNFKKIEAARYNALGQKVDKSFKGLQIVVYTDGSTRRVMNNNE